LAHNGKLKGIKRRPLAYYRPIGTTDSEYAFCWILDQVRARFPARPRSERRLRRFIGELAQDIDALGPFNMLLCDSRDLYCHCSTNLSWLTRRAPFGPASLIDTDMIVDFAKETTPKDIVTVIATQPLTHHEPWVRMDPGSLVVFHDGLPVAV
ncbi:MAG: class II glutamine amidotransferase, partial [Kiloniellales bacterium]|nr:class II glutamine amidotransferase [Kiloniellales bacterium]